MPRAWLFYVVLSRMVLLDLIMNWHLFNQVCDDGFKTIVFPLLLYLNLGCNNSFRTPRYVELLVNLCNMWLVFWILYDLGCVIGLFKILCDTWWTTGFIWAQVWQCDRFGGCHCTCALINWSVQPHIQPLIDVISKQLNTITLFYWYGPIGILQSGYIHSSKYHIRPLQSTP